MSAEQASQFYQDFYEMEGFSDAVAHLYSGHVLALVLSGPGAIDHLLDLLGPESYKVYSGVTNELRDKQRKHMRDL